MPGKVHIVESPAGLHVRTLLGMALCVLARVLIRGGKGGGLRGLCRMVDTKFREFHNRRSSQNSILLVLLR
jgi:hypothetical protein